MKMTNPLMQNSLTGVQSAQQAPVGIPPALAAYFATQQQAQQQGAAQPQAPTDQSQLADYIRQLQDSGASNEQIQNMVGQVQSTGQLPDQAQPDTLQGGDGGDQIANSTGNDTISGADSNSTIPQTFPNVSGASQPQQSPLSQALNQMASGQPNINYDQVGASYPQAQPLLQTSPLDSFSRAALKNSNAGNAASVFQAIQAGRQDQMNQQNAAIAQQNQQALGAYGSQVGIAEHAGTIAQEKARNDREAKYQDAEIAARKDETQRKADAEKSTIVTMADGSLGYIDSHHPEDGVTPLSGTKGKDGGLNKQNAALDLQINKQTGLLLGTLDTKGNSIKDAPTIDPTHFALVKAAIAKRVQGGESPADAAVNLAEEMGVKSPDDLINQTTPSKFLGMSYNSSTGRKALPTNAETYLRAQILNAAPQTSPNVNGAPAAASVPNVTPQTAPTVTGTPSVATTAPSAATAITGAQGGGSAVDNLVQQYLRANPKATAAQAAKARMLAIQKVNGQ